MSSSPSASSRNWRASKTVVLPDVHDGPVGLGVEPPEAPGVLRQELPDGLLELPVRGQGSNGQDVRQEHERVGLGLAERVAHHHLGEGSEPVGPPELLEDE